MIVKVLLGSAPLAALVYFLPTNVAMSVVAASATVAFAVYATRERRAIRGISSRLRTNTESLTFLRKHVDEQQELTDIYSSKLDALASGLDRLHTQERELANLNAIATKEIVSRVNRLDESIKASQSTAESVERTISSESRRTRSETLQAAKNDFGQLEALVTLHSVFHVRGPLPPSRGWAVSPDLLLHLTSLIKERQPHTVVELGSGLSTVWLAYALENAGGSGRVVSLDHDAQFADNTRRLLLAHGLDHLAEVRHAPLVEIEADGESWSWYDPASLEDIRQCDFLFVDGPPAAVRRMARYPAFLHFSARLSAHAVVVLDDCIRQDEQEIVNEWRRRYPEWNVQRVNHEKGTTIFTR